MQKFIPNWAKRAGLILIVLALSVAGCQTRDSIVTYLVANKDGTVDSSSLHTQASSRVEFQTVDLLISVRRLERDSEVFEVQLTTAEAIHSDSKLRVDNISLVDVDGRNLDDQVELERRRNIKDGGMWIEDYELDLSALSEPSTLKLRIAISGKKGEEDVFHEKTIAFVRTKVEIPVSWN